MDLIESIKVNLLVNLEENSFIATTFFRFKREPDDGYVVLEIGEKTEIQSIRQKGVSLECFGDLEHNVVKVCCSNFMDGPVAVAYGSSLDHEPKGLFRVDDESIASQFGFGNLKNMIPVVMGWDGYANVTVSVAITTNGTVLTSGREVGRKPMPQGRTQFNFAEVPHVKVSEFGIAITHYEKVSGKVDDNVSVELYGSTEQSCAEMAASGARVLSEMLGVSLPAPLSIVLVSDYPQAFPSPRGVIFVPNCVLEKEYSFALYVFKQLAYQFIRSRLRIDKISDLWIPEGLSTCLAYYVFDKLYPDCHGWGEFLVDHVVPVLNMDTSNMVEAIAERNIDDVEPEDLFDELWVSKSACVFRMAIESRGFESLQRLLHDYDGKSVDADAIVHHFGDAFMRKWVHECGYPAVIVDEDLSLFQVRFTTSRQMGGDDWELPLEILYSENSVETRKKLVLTHEFASLGIDSEKLDWIIVNPDSKSLCRVFYRGNTRQKVLACKSISKEDASMLKLNIAAFCDMGLLPGAVAREFSFSDDLDPFKRFAQRRMPLIRGNGTKLAEQSEL